MHLNGHIAVDMRPNSVQRLPNRQPKGQGGVMLMLDLVLQVPPAGSVTVDLPPTKSG